MRQNLPFICKDSGLYVIRKNDFDPIAYKILQDRQPDILLKPKPLDIDALVYEGFNLETKEVILSETGVILGMIAFEELTIPIYTENNQEDCVEVEAGTIIIEKKLHLKPTRYNFTKTHELSHWILHRRFYSVDKREYFFRKNDRSYIERAEEAMGRKNPQIAVTDKQISEWQADCLSAALLMPKKTFLEALVEIVYSYGVVKLKLNEESDKKTHQVIAELAKLFNVSCRSVIIRLNTLELLA